MDEPSVPDCVASFPHVESSDSDYARVEYLLKMCLRSASATIVSLHSISSPHLNLQFEKVTKGKLVVDSWINSNVLDDLNPIERVVSSGFVVPDSGAIFATGEIGDIADFEEGAAVPSGPRRYEFMLCKVGVGRSYLMEVQAVDASTEIPAGFHSIYVHHGDRSQADEEEEEEDLSPPPVPSYAPRNTLGLSYHHQYLVKQSAQVLPQYYVVFEFDPLADQRTKVEDELRSARALYEQLKKQDCLEDAIELRELIRTIEKSVNEVNMSVDGGAPDEIIRVLNQGRMDIRMIVDRVKGKIPHTASLGGMFFGNCHHHPQQPLEFWDPVWNCPVCVYCKMIGSHASGEAAAHQLMPIEKAYEQAVSASRKEDRLLEGRRQAILSHLRTVDERLEKINQNASVVEERIYRILQEAMTKLQEETQHKLSVLLGEEAELRRQLQQLDWMDAFLEYEKKVLSGFSFLDAWRHHQSLRTYIQQTPVLRSQLDVYPDLKVEGDIRVVTDALIREEQQELHEVESEKAKTHLASAASTSYRQSLFSNFASPALRRVAPLGFGGGGGGGFGEPMFGGGGMGGGPPMYQPMEPTSAMLAGPSSEYGRTPEYGGGVDPAFRPMGGGPHGGGMHHEMDAPARTETQMKAKTTDELWRENVPPPAGSTTPGAGTGSGSPR